MATKQQDIVDAINGALTANQGAGTFYAAVGGRIYDTFAPQNSTMPMAVFTIVTDEVQQYFVTDSVLLDFQVDVYGLFEAGPKASRAIGDLAYALLHRTTLSITGYSGCSILCQSRAPGLDVDMVAGGRTQQDAFRDTRTYRLFGTCNS